MQILWSEKRKAERDFGRFTGLTYGDIRHWYKVKEDKFKDLGNRIREMRDLGMVRIEKGDDGRIRVFPLRTAGHNMRETKQ